MIEFPTHYAKTKTLISLIKAAANVYGEKPFITPVEEDIDVISFNGLWEFVLKFECFLNDNNVSDHGHVAVVFQNSTLMLLIFLSVISNGRVLIPINPKAGKKEIDYILEAVKPEIVIYDFSIEEKLKSFLAENRTLPVQDDSVFINDILAIDISGIDKQANPLQETTEDTVAEIVFTSGTTGDPKGVVLTHRNILADSYGIAREFDFFPSTNFLTVCPLFHNSGQIPTTLTPLWCGAVTTAVRSDLGLSQFWYFVDHYEINWSFVTPTFISYLCSSPRYPKFNTLKGLFSGGAKLTPKMLRIFEEKFSVDIHEAYGLTETTSFATCVGKDIRERKKGSSGKALSINHVKIFKNGKELPPGTKGEIVIKGDNLFKEYLNLPEITNKRKGGGWFHSGDLGYLDEEGNLFVLERLDSMILIGGENVYPTEIENLIPHLTGMREGVLSAIPHPILENELILVYLKSADVNVDINEWKNFLSTQLSNYKVPRRFIDVEELGIEDIPKAQNGKLLRKEIKDLLRLKLTEA